LISLSRLCPRLSPILSAMHLLTFFLLFFFNDTATTEIYTLSLHDALPIFNLDPDRAIVGAGRLGAFQAALGFLPGEFFTVAEVRSEEHTSELQSLTNLVCRLLLEKKKQKSLTHVRRHIVKLALTYVSRIHY